MTSIASLVADDLPATWGRYTLTSILGEGGMGRVFAAELAAPGGFRKRVALKVLRGRTQLTDVDREDLLREARVGGLLHHRHVVDVYDTGTTDGQPWISMELVDGLGLGRLLAATGALPPGVVVEVGLAVAAGLDHAHRLALEDRPVGLVHRDLKPDNVLLGTDGAIKVGDFGIARFHDQPGDVTGTAVIKGTPCYMAPEQAAGDELDARADVFALGLLLYEMVTGERLLTGDSVVAVIMKLVQLAEIVPPAVDRVEEAFPGLGPLVGRCLSADRTQRPADARAVADSLRSLLGGLPPAPALDALVQDVAAGGDGRRLTGIERAVTLGPTTTSGPAGNLGDDLDGFVGRAADLAALGTAVGEARLVTVLGPGGTGKTRLARRFGRAQQLAYPGGVWFVDLAESRDTAGVLASVSAAFGLRLRGSEEVDRVGYALAGRGPLLLILDNLEQVVEVAPTLSRWLALSPTTVILTTSRERLRARGERVVELGPLPEDDAVALLLERARAARPGLTPDEETLRSIAVQLDCLPLALELAAARLRLMSPEAVLSRLGERFRLLRGGRGRQATLQSTLQWSWDLLEGGEQEALALLSTFRGGFTVEMAEGLLSAAGSVDATWALDHVEALRDKSLLRIDADHAEPRFGMLESVRAFAELKLDERGQRATGERAHADALLSILEPSLPRLTTHGGEALRRRLGEERANLEAVRTRFGASEPVLAARATLPLAEALKSYGPLDRHAAILAEALPHLDALPRALAVALSSEAVLGFRNHGRHADGEDVARRALDLAGDDGGLRSEALRGLAYCRAALGHRREAVSLCDEALALGEQLRNPTLIGQACAALATVLAGVDADRSLATHERSLSVARERGDERMVATELCNLGVQHAQTGETAAAEREFRASYQLFRELGYRPASAVALSNLGELEIQQGKHEAGLRALGRSRIIAREAGDRAGEARILVELAAGRHLLGDLEAAADLLGEASALLDLVGRNKNHGTLHLYRAALLLEEGRVRIALDAADRSVTAYAAAGRTDLRLPAQVFEAAVLACHGDVEEAADELRALRVALDEGHPMATLTWLAEGFVDLARADRGDAEAHRLAARSRLMAHVENAPVAAQLMRRCLAAWLR